MIKNKSRRTSALITLEVQKDITSKGWLCMRSEEEAAYDLIVDMGLDENNQRVFETIQVKKHLRTSSRPNNGKGEPVSTNGKSRNSYNYFDEDVTYLASINNHNRVYYIHKDDYKYKTQSQLKNAKESIFPVNEKMQGYRVDTETYSLPTLVEHMS